MKRKFAFGLSPLKIPSRAENKALKEALNVNFDESPVSTPLSPFINRRTLDRRTEELLHAACASIVKGYDPEEELQEDLENAHTLSSFLHKPSGSQKPVPVRIPSKGRSQSTSHLPTTVPTTRTPRRDPTPKEFTKSSQDFTRPDTVRHQDQARGPGDKQFPPRVDSYTPHPPIPINSMPKSAMDRPRTAPTDSSDVSYATPKSASTDQQFQYPSTAITSAALTPARVSHHGAKSFVLDPESYQAKINEADNQAAIWMKAELERRKQSQEYEARPTHSRSSTRTWKDQIQEYVRPRTADGSRSASRDSHTRKPIGRSTSRDSDSRKRSGSFRSPSSQGWRSWGLQRKSSKSSMVERSPSTGQQESPIRDMPTTVQRKEIDLNRELPPLPSLDTWQDEEPKPSPGMHIASLMRSKSKKAVSRKSLSKSTVLPSESPSQDFQVARAIATRKPKSLHDKADTEDGDLPVQAPTRSRAQSLPKSENRAATACAAPDVPTMTGRPHSKTSSSVDSCFSPVDSVSIDLNRMSRRMKSIENFKSTSNLSYRRDSSTTAPPTRPITRDGKAMNFSRKISIDGQGRVCDARQPNAAEITALPQIPVKKQTFATLRKVLSKLELKERSKNMNWMSKFEADGVKSGVMIQTDTSPAPIIRY